MRPVPYLLAFWIALGAVASAAAQEAHPRVAVHTSMGDIVLELDRERAPVTVANFLTYVMEGHYDDTLIYRVVPGFVIQGGSVGADGNGRFVHDPIPLEANNGLKNLRGSVTMAHGDDPNSATADFFIVLKDAPSLDQSSDDTENKTGYAVFGHVTSGMDVVDTIAGVPLGGQGPFAGEAPATPIVVRSMEFLQSEPQPQP